jgi:hypothetical protein
MLLQPGNTSLHPLHKLRMLPTFLPSSLIANYKTISPLNTRLSSIRDPWIEKQIEKRQAMRVSKLLALGSVSLSTNNLPAGLLVQECSNTKQSHIGVHTQKRISVLEYESEQRE